MQYPRHIISTEQFLDRDLLQDLFTLTDHYRAADAEHAVPRPLVGKLIASLFYEASTRTRMSFEAAMRKLGGDVITTENARKFSSVAKGETLADTIRVIGGYVEAIILRHHQEGAAERAATVAPVPIINAGDGAGEHPTQALLDLYTIRSELKRLDTFRIALMGDLRYGRTIHSLVRLLTQCPNVHVYLVSPEALRLPPQYIHILNAHGIPYKEMISFEEVPRNLDVVYILRIQKERKKHSEGRRSAGKDLHEKAAPSPAAPHVLHDQLHCAPYRLDPEVLERCAPNAIILHPLPRTNELDPAVDRSPRAAYFRQARNGLYLRMALLSRVLAPNHF
ncbi:aspartate carbamoyltransferase [Candidatus Uhrbacteria bacterium]|nr:aspartate carbamoyltransferase [Candidatus Uhrbacteria bacterium]